MISYNVPSILCNYRRKKAKFLNDLKEVLKVLCVKLWIRINIPKKADIDGETSNIFEILKIMFGIQNFE